jgi:hypothetical protein
VKENELDHSVEFMLSEDATVYGFQFSIRNAGFDLIGGVIPVSKTNMAKDKEGFTNISWGQSSPLEIKAGEVLFTIGNMAQHMPVEELLVLDEEGLFPEIYTEHFDNQKIEFLPYRQIVTGGMFETKVSPNPFTDVTKLQIMIPAGESFTVNLYDIKGRELFTRNYVSYSNESEVIITSDMVKMPGVYYYRVKSNLGELSGKFIRQ